MKVKIADIERESAASADPEAYRDCLYHKYEWERKVNYIKELRGRTYYYKRYDEMVGPVCTRELMCTQAQLETSC